MKKIKILYILLFVIICFTPLVLMPFIKNNAEIEKRELTEFPSFINEGRFNVNFSEQFESWFNDRLPLRSYLLSTANFLKSEILKAPSSNVIVGKDGWLFYETEKADFINSNAMTDNQVNAVGITLSLIEEAINEKGGKFTFVAMPNKASVYDDKMPNSYKKAETNNLIKINNKLDELGVTHVDMLKVMKENKSKGIYHKRDSHWNYQGALIGYNAIMDSLNKEHKTYADATYKIEKTWRGDLDKLLYPVGGFMDDQYVYNIDYSAFSFETNGRKNQDPKAQLENYMSDKEDGDDNFTSLNKNVKDGRKLFMSRDSFGRAILPFFIDNYARATFKRTDNPDIVTVANDTDMVYEIVERNLNRVIGTAPYVFAPRRNNINDVSDGGTTPISKYSVEGYGIRVYGVLDDDIDLSNSRIYIELSKGDEVITYEAFPIVESKLLGTDKKNGYSLFINSKDSLNGTYKVKVICGNKYYTAEEIVLGEEKANEIVTNELVKDDKNTLKDEKYRIYGKNFDFIPGDTFESVKDKMGEEIKPSESFRACMPGVKGESTLYFFDGIDITVSYAGIISSVNIKSDKFFIKPDILVGRNIDGLNEILGEPSFDSEYGGSYQFDDVSISFIYDEGKIMSISVEDASVEL